MGVSEQDKALFRQAMQTVSPLKKRAKKAVVQKSTPVSTKTRHQAMKNPRELEICELSHVIKDEVFAETVLSYTGTGMSKRQFSQFRNGKIPWQARLDLHGETIDSASKCLLQFLSRQKALGHRSLLIIHGKGGQRGQPSLLKSCMNQWLREIADVIAFHSALPREGGSGALYVLLKRQLSD